MQSVQSVSQDDGAEPELLANRNRNLAAAFKPHELVWLVDERYVSIDESWLVDVVRRGEEGRWMRQRYRYDVPSSVIYFLGERPVSDEELTGLRRSGKVFPVGKLQQQLNEPAK